VCWGAVRQRMRMRWRSRCFGIRWRCCVVRCRVRGTPPADRMLLATLARVLPRERWAVLLVKPSTLLRWHRELIVRRWTYPRTGRDPRSLDEQVVALVVRLA